MKTPEKIKKVKDDPTCFECNHYEVCQMWSNAGYKHKDNPKKCSHFAGRSSERRKISTLQIIVDEQDKVIQQLEAQVPRWISVEERLPEIAEHRGKYDVSVRVLCACLQKSGRRMVKEGYFEIFDGKYFDWRIPGTIDKVTHWMPLPEPPTKEATQ